MADTGFLPENLDAVLRKYGKIWIWSILLAAVAALSMRAFAGTASILTFPNLARSVGSVGPRDLWSPIWLLLAFIPSLGTLAAVYFLLQFLRYHILPFLFPAPAAAPSQEPQNFTLTGAPTGDSAAVLPVEEIPDGAEMLYRAFAAVVIAMAIEAGEALLSILYRSVVH